MAILISIFIIGCIFLLVKSLTALKNQKELYQHYKEVQNFSESRLFYNKFALIAVDENRREVLCILKRELRDRLNQAKLKVTGIELEYNVHRIAFTDILKSEVRIDNNIYSSKSTSRTVTGGIAGAVLLGGVGAVVGGLSGNSKRVSKTTNINLAITTKNISAPLIVIPFFNSMLDLRSKETVSTNPIIRSRMKDVEEWQAIISIIIDRIDSESKEVVAKVVPKVVPN